MEWGFNLSRMGLSWSSVPMATPSSSVWWRCPTENPFSVMENPLKNDQPIFFAPQNMDGEWWRMKWCLEIYWNLPLLWFLFRDSLGWCYQCDRLRGLKISGNKIWDKSLNKSCQGCCISLIFLIGVVEQFLTVTQGWFRADHSLGLCVDTVTYVDGVLWCTIKSCTLGFSGFGWAD